MNFIPVVTLLPKWDSSVQGAPEAAGDEQVRHQMGRG